MLSRRLLPRTFTGEQVFRYFDALNSGVFWLDSGEGASHGKSYLGASDEVHSCEPGHERDFLNMLGSRLGGLPKHHSSKQAKLAIPTFSLGWVGWFSYEFGVRLLDIEHLSNGPVDEHKPSSARMLYVSTAIEIDHATGECWLLAENEKLLLDWMEHHYIDLEASLSQPRPKTRISSTATHQGPVWRDSRETYLRNVVQCQETIERGDAYLLCLTTQTSRETDEQPADIFFRLRALNPTHHSGFLRAGDLTLLSASPEQFLAVDAHGNAMTKPIKGTRARGVDEREDRALADELQQNEKELAENLMIVDLMRNDFLRACEPDSVQVTSLHSVERYAQVHQLVSTVTGKLKTGVDALDLFAACFPAGSMTGTPKLRAVEILARLEGAERGIYSGCFGYISQDGSIDLAMVIRSIVIRDGLATIGTGGGVTSSSEPHAEYAEARLKAQSLLAALQG